MDSTFQIESLLGRRISHAWLSHSALYLELGPLSPGRQLKRGGVGNPRGQLSIFVGYEWRIERLMSILGGSGTNPRRRNNLVTQLIEQNIETVQTIGRLPELYLGLSSGLSLVTFSTESGQPEWGVHFNEGNSGYLGVKRGSIRFSRAST